jgi:hypothetical protein
MSNLVNDPKAAVREEITKRGAFVGFDLVGREPALDEKDVPRVLEMLNAG